MSPSSPRCSPDHSSACSSTTGTAEAEATLAFAGNYLQLRTIEFAFIGLFHVLVGAHRGAGKTKTAMVFSMVTLWFCRVPAVYYLALVRDLDPTGIWLGVTIGHVIGAVTAGLGSLAARGNAPSSTAPTSARPAAASTTESGDYPLSQPLNRGTGYERVEGA